VSRRNVLLLLLALWLPLQAALAFAMPFCGHGQDKTAAAVGDHHAGHHHAAPSPDEAEAAPSDPLADCDLCGLCHLACAGFLAPATGHALAEVPRHVLVGLDPQAMTSPDPDRLDRPPLSAA
jgi:hypothetical protein